MRNQLFLAIFVLVALASCGSDTGESTASASGDEAAPTKQAELPGSGGGQVLVISKRTYTSGRVKVQVSGSFEVDGRRGLNQPASITDEGHTWIQYGVSGAPELNVLFTNSEDMVENGVTIGGGPYTVTGTSTSGECRSRIDMQPATVPGHYSCTGSTGYNNQTVQMGKVDIKVEFSAGS